MTESRKVPKLRFPEFSGDWEQRKLGDVGSTYTGLSGKTKVDFGHGKAKFVTYMNVFSNTVASSMMIEPIEIDERQNKVLYGDVFFTTSSETPEEVGMSSVWLENSDNTYLNSFCFGYRPKEHFDPYYLAYMLRSPSIRGKIVFLAQGISRYNISKNKMMDIEIPIPQIKEQNQIGLFFHNLDSTITLHQRKLETLKKVKKSFLQKMFPKNGEKIPEIRFPEFSGDWEQRKLGDMGSTFTGLSGKCKDDFDHGDAKYIPYINIYSNEKIDLNNLKSIEIDQKQNAVQLGDVFFTTSSETPEEVGMSSVLTEDLKDTYLNSFCFGYRPSIKFNLNFLAFLLRSPSFRTDMILLAQGISRYNISKNKVMDIKISIPSLKEQNLIGKFLDNVDATITLHQRKLEVLNKLKKAMLQNMFV